MEVSRKLATLSWMAPVEKVDVRAHQVFCVGAIEALCDCDEHLAPSQFVMRLAYTKWVHAATEICQSPIEQMMLASLLWDRFGHFHTPNMLCTKPTVPDRVRPARWLIVHPQHQWDPRITSDFAAIVCASDGAILEVAIECDGHDYHERTKEQAMRDRQRDRWFQSKGIPLFRYTGSEIWRDPRACIEDMSVFVANWLDVHKRRSA